MSPVRHGFMPLNILLEHHVALCLLLELLYIETRNTLGERRPPTNRTGKNEPS